MKSCVGLGGGRTSLGGTNDGDDLLFIAQLSGLGDGKFFVPSG